MRQKRDVRNSVPTLPQRLRQRIEAIHTLGREIAMEARELGKDPPRDPMPQEEN